MKTTLEYLKEGRELISDPARWTQSYYARDKDEMGIPPADPRAVCWCSIGAIYKVVDPQGLLFNDFRHESIVTVDIDSVWIAIGTAISKIVESVSSVASYNDQHSHEDVLKAWDAAIEAESVK